MKKLETAMCIGLILSDFSGKPFRLCPKNTGFAKSVCYDCIFLQILILKLTRI